MILTDNYKQTQEQLAEIKSKIDEKIGEAQAEDGDQGEAKQVEQTAPKGGEFHERLYP